MYNVDSAPTKENVISWLKKTKKTPCSNCKGTDFQVSDMFGIISQIPFNAPQTLPAFPNEFQKIIVIVCKQCGKTELFDAHIAGFADLIR